MILVTNTHSIVNMENCTLLSPDGKPITADYPLVTCRNCNNDGHKWGREGANGGQLDMNLKNQKWQEYLYILLLLIQMAV